MLVLASQRQSFKYQPHLWETISINPKLHGGRKYVDQGCGSKHYIIKPRRERDKDNIVSKPYEMVEYNYTKTSQMGAIILMAGFSTLVKTFGINMEHIYIMAKIYV